MLYKGTDKFGPRLSEYWNPCLCLPTGRDQHHQYHNVMSNFESHTKEDNKIRILSWFRSSTVLLPGRPRNTHSYGVMVCNSSPWKDPNSGFKEGPAAAQGGRRSPATHQRPPTFTPRVLRPSGGMPRHRQTRHAPSGCGLIGPRCGFPASALRKVAGYKWG